MLRRVPLLDNPVWTSLSSGHEELALRAGHAACYPQEVSPLAGLADSTSEAMGDLATLVSPGGIAGVIAGDAAIDPRLWRELDRIELIQMVGDASVAAADAEPGPLSSADVPEMLALAEQTRPGPFAPRTIEMGRYIGLRENGRLVAMAANACGPRDTRRSAPSARPRAIAAGASPRPSCAVS